MLEEGESITWDLFYAQYGEKILNALCFAFGENVIHRDLSTRNIIITNNNNLRIIDFGQAKTDETIIGRTVAGWTTPPYCIPEPDTGRFTYTRDPYSFCAIAIRAISGRRIDDHDQLYDELSKIVLPIGVKQVVESALSREPSNRPENIKRFKQLLLNQKEVVGAPQKYVLPIRCAPSVLEKLDDSNDEDNVNIFGDILADLNNAVSIVLQNDIAELKFRISINTQSYSFIADVDSYTSSNLVIISATRNYIPVNALYKDGVWLPEVTFTPITAESKKEKESAKNNIQRFYDGLNEQIDAHRRSLDICEDDLFIQWGRLLEAMRYIARTKERSLNYNNAEISGLRLTVDVKNPFDAHEDEVRTITNNKKCVFVGVVEEVVGNKCTLYSNWPHIRHDSIPFSGTLDVDWAQTRIALDRQSKALSKFSDDTVANRRLSKLVRMIDVPRKDPTFAKVRTFYDKNIDSDKKSIVSRCLAESDLFLVHGPPGTGKTKLIAELIRQEINSGKNPKILLVSQTHVAVDNALENLTDMSGYVSIVRIGSGTKTINNKVDMFTVEAHGKELLNNIEKSTEAYIKSISDEYGIDHGEVEAGRKSVEVIRLRNVIKDKNEYRIKVKAELDQLGKYIVSMSANNTTRDESEARARIRELESSLSSLESELDLLTNELDVAVEQLSSVNHHGKNISKITDQELVEWCDLLLQGNERRRIRDLLELAEDWKLKFSKSEDFKVAIIANASVVAGTCVGFCREAAAYSIAYDLCIIDEASKATTTELLVPMSVAKKIILVGDHHQLPAVIDYALSSEKIKEEYLLSDEQLEQQLFETLQVNLPDGYKEGLKTQYRMRSTIGSLVSSCFYKDDLQNYENVDERNVPDLSLAGLKYPVTWINTDSKNAINALETPSKTSYKNQAEIDQIVSLLSRLQFVFSQGGNDYTKYKIAIISGYNAQVEALRRQIRKRPELDTLDIVCDSVHAFQGREVDICIYSITRNNNRGDVGFLRDWRHLNVALSRARDFLVVVGSMRFCKRVSEPNPFMKLVSYIESSMECEIKEYLND